MVAMPAQQQTDVSQETVVEFGSSPAEPRRRRFDLSGLGRDLARDRRAVPLTAAVAALALLVSILSEWQVTKLDASALGVEVGERVLPSSLDDLSALGMGYVLGLFLLVPTVVLTLFGPPPGRHYTRLAGLSIGGMLLALLLAVVSALGSHSYIIDPVYRIALDDGEIQLAYGRGLWCAFAGVILALVALWLAGRHLPSPAAARASSATTDDSAEPVEEEAAVWSWQRPAAGRRDQWPAEEPLDLTVSPAQPFTTLNDDRDRLN